MADFELAIIGGGISGLGVALEASRRGLRTILFERDIICGATSANSLRIIHGGFRYLQTFDVPRILESIRAQTWFLDNYREYVEPLPCLMPLEKFGTKSKYPVMLALKLYKQLKRLVSGIRSDLPDGQIMPSALVQKEVALFTNVASNGALLWYDLCLKDPEHFVRTLVEKLKIAGVDVQEGNEVQQIQRKQDHFELLTQTGPITARFVVNATGPWLDNLALQDHHARNKSKKSAAPYPHKRRPRKRRGAPSWCRAFNVILKRRLEDKYALGFAGGSNLYFLVPRGEVSVLGTGYLTSTNHNEKPNISELELMTFLEKATQALPSLVIGKEDILLAEVGLIPIHTVGNGKIYPFGRERIFEQDGYLEILSTKYTTFLEQAKRALEKIY